MKFTVLAFAALTTLAPSACKRTDEARPLADARVVEAPTTPDSAAGTGVADCDRYLERVYACVNDKVPDPQREMASQGIEQSRASWSAATDKTALAVQCRTAMAQARTAYAAMGCSF